MAINFTNLLFFPNPPQVSRSISPAALVEGMKVLNHAPRAPFAVSIIKRVQRELGNTSDSTLALCTLLTHNVKTWRNTRPEAVRLGRLHIGFPRYMGWTPLENP